MALFFILTFLCVEGESSAQAVGHANAYFVCQFASSAALDCRGPLVADSFHVYSIQWTNVLYYTPKTNLAILVTCITELDDLVLI